MREEHFHLLPFVARYFIGLRLSACASNVARILMGFTRDGTRIRVWATPILGRADLAGGFQGAIFLSAGDVLAAIGVGIIAPELF